MFRKILVFTVFCFGSLVNAHEAGPAPQVINPMQLIMSVVKINNATAQIFSAEPDGGHGTGFFVGINRSNGKGVIFTNRHVIESDDLHAQHLTVSFNTKEKRNEVIGSNLVYVSRLHDFAVIEFDPKLLKRADLSRPLILPGKDSPFRDFVTNERLLRGAEVMAIGNPFDGSNVTTYGQITALRFDDHQGPFIQTQTPINPGNSGGPLISLDTGEVVGMNTLTRRGADGTHFSIPIGVLMEEYELWRSQAQQKSGYTIAEPRSIGVNFSPASESDLVLLGLRDSVAKAVKGYWDNFHSVLMVSDAPEGSTLNNNDILLRINDEVIGGYPYDLSKALQNATGTVKLQVLRLNPKPKVVELDVPVRVDAFHSRREKVDFVYISGLLLQEAPKRITRLVRPDLAEHRVMVSELVDSPETNFSPRSFPRPYSVLSSVTLGGVDYPVKSLLDLKLALQKHPKDKALIMRFYRSNWIQTEDKIFPARSANGMPLLEGSTSMFVLPLSEVLTPRDFSIHQFKKQFGFGSNEADTRDWRQFIREPEECETKLTVK